MIVRGIQTSRIPIAQQTLLGLLERYVAPLPERSVLVITSKLVSVCAGRFVERDAAQKQALIEKEAEHIGVVITDSTTAPLRCGVNGRSRTRR